MELQNQLLGSRMDRVCINGFDTIVIHNCGPEIRVYRCCDEFGFYIESVRSWINTQ